MWTPFLFSILVLASVLAQPSTNDVYLGQRSCMSVTLGYQFLRYNFDKIVDQHLKEYSQKHEDRQVERLLN